jgi:hypothetical protein
MTSVEIYQLAQQHTKQVDMWHDRLGQDAFDTLIKQGYFDPKCYALSYSFITGEYSTTTIAMEPDAISDPERNEATYQCLKSIEKNVNHTLICIIFISEGSVKNDELDTNHGFIIITFENKVSGWKKVYRLVKRSALDTQGNFRYDIESVVYDDNISINHNVPMLEKFSHILRPNYYNKLDPVYN